MSKRFQIQIFRGRVGDVTIGHWDNTAWGSDDRASAEDVFKKVSSSSNTLGILKVRLLEVLQEEEIKSSD